MADFSETSGDESALKAELGAKLGGLCGFYAVPANSLDQKEIFSAAAKSVEEDTAIPVELAVAREALVALREAGTSKVEFASEPQEEVLALRAFFGLTQQAAAKALNLQVSEVADLEKLSIVSLRERIGSIKQGPLSDTTAEPATISTDDPAAKPTEGAELFVGAPFETDVYEDPPTQPVGIVDVASDAPSTPKESTSIPLYAAPPAAVASDSSNTRTKTAGIVTLLSLLFLALLAGTYFSLSGWDSNNGKSNALQTEVKTATTLPRRTNPPEQSLTVDNTSLNNIDELEASTGGTEATNTTSTTETTETTDSEASTETSGSLITTTTAAATTTVPSFAEPILVNGGFEANRNEGVNYYPQIEGWAASDGIEIWSDGRNGVSSPEGQYFVELNSGGPNEMLTEVEVSPGSIIEWRLDHRGRAGVDSMIVVFESATGAQESWRLDTGKEWKTYRFDYAVPSDTNTVRVRLISITDGSIANLIDNFDVTLSSQNQGTGLAR